MARKLDDFERRAVRPALGVLAQRVDLRRLEQNSASQRFHSMLASYAGHLKHGAAMVLRYSPSGLLRMGRVVGKASLAGGALEAAGLVVYRALVAPRFATSEEFPCAVLATGKPRAKRQPGFLSGRAVH